MFRGQVHLIGAGAVLGSILVVMLLLGISFSPIGCSICRRIFGGISAH